MPDSRAWLTRQRIQFTEGIMYQGKSLQDLWNKKDIVGYQSNKNQVVGKGSDVSIGTQPEEEGMQRHRFIETSK
jgi:hypothetical protein